MITSTSSQSFPTTSFLFGDKSSTSIFDKPNNVPLFGGGISVDSTKTDDIKSTSLFGGSSSNPTSSSSIFSTFSSPTESFATLAPTEPLTPKNTLFSKTDDNKSTKESLFSFSPKTDSPFKFGVTSKDPTSVFGQNLFSHKNKPANEGIYTYLCIIYLIL